MRVDRQRICGIRLRFQAVRACFCCGTYDFERLFKAAAVIAAHFCYNVDFSLFQIFM